MPPDDRQPETDPATLPPHAATHPDDPRTPAATVEFSVPAAEASPPPQVPGYEVLDVLGRGGMGVVYRARHLTLHRVVALKMILHAAHAGEDERLRFLREAEAMAAIRHPGVVQVFDYGTHDGAPYFAMEYCEGGSLAKKLSGKPLPPREAAEVAEQVARGVQAAHEAGVVHRDLKPANVLLASPSPPGPLSHHGERGSLSASSPLSPLSGRGAGDEGLPRDAVKVTDFGLARRLNSGGGLTQTGAVMGTPSYVAPEQARSTKEAGPLADVYAVGAILYECLTGRPPFIAATPLETLHQVLTEEPPTPRSLNPALPRDLETICLKCLSKDLPRRYESAAALADDLRRWLCGEPILARPAGATERAVKWARRRPGLAAGLCGALLAVAAVLTLAVVALYQWGEADRQRQSADEQRRKAEQALKDRDEAERRRALAQIDALRDAAPGAVPGILANLERHRGEILDDLRRLHRQEADPARRARLALALLPVEQEAVRGELVESMLKADDPAESVLIRGVLRPHSAGLPQALWARAGDQNSSDAERLRALVALAEFDPEGDGWKGAAGPLVKTLLAENPLHLGTWVLALERVSRFLSGPLGAWFRDEKPENAGRREAAAQALKLYLTRRPDPETLYELLLDSDARQYALLRPLLEKHKEQAVARMSAELAKQPDHWKDPPLERTWAAPEAAVVAQIEKGGGIVAERWALCQALPMDRLPAVTQAMGKAGYRPLSVRPWGRDRAALVWARDGRQWKLQTDLTLEALKRVDAGHQKSGLIPADVAAYGTKDGERYVGLWRRGEGEKSVLFAAVEPEEIRDRLGPLQESGYFPARVQGRTDAARTRYCGVWTDRKAEGGAVRWAGDEGLHAGLVADDAALLLDVSLRAAPPPRPLSESLLAELKRARAAAEEQPQNGQARFSRGLALFRLGRDEEALGDFDFLVEKFPRVALAYRYRAVLLARVGRAREARADLARFAKLNTQPRQLPPLTALIGVLLGVGEQALAKLDGAIEADNDPALAYDAAGVYSRAAERARARQAAWAASLLGSPSPLALAARPRPELEGEYAGRAVELLRLAAQRGHDDLEAIHTDEDLEAIRDRPDYREFLRQRGMLRSYASVWNEDAGRQSEGLQGLSPAAHLERCRELASRGYRPVSLSLADLPQEKGPLAASVWHRPVVLPQKEALAKRQATAAATLLSMGKGEQVWPLFRHSPDPTRRSWLVWRAGERGADPKLLIDRLLVEKDVSARRALILALGEYDGKRLPQKDRKPLVETLLRWYGDDPDPGVHSAIGWLLRNRDEGSVPRLLDWGQANALDALDKGLAGKKPRLSKPDAPARADRGGGWYVTGQGQTLVMIEGPVEFRMGAPHWEPDQFPGNERRHLRRIGRNYAIASTTVTVAQWQAFLKDNPDVKTKEFLPRYAPEDGCPMIVVSFYAAARYCNWLSQKEGIPPEQWCYPRQITSGMRMPAGYLGRTGYRLPTESEMEFACRAGSRASRCYGSPDALLARYGHYIAISKDRTWPVGQKRPNDLGLFDVHGNVWNWCQEEADVYPRRARAAPRQDVEDLDPIDESSHRAMRGGSFFNLASNARSANRTGTSPVRRSMDYGFRVCRTLPPDAFAAPP
jgi:formylglycine-generating enzyme required for sulfatase activity/tetratricopeptide (TPR) repeat protein